MRAVQPTSLRLRGADGLAIHALEWSREGTPLVFLHGFSNEAHVWDDAAPAVAAYYRTLALEDVVHDTMNGHRASGFQWLGSKSGAQTPLAGVQ